MKASTLVYLAELITQERKETPSPNDGFSRFQHLAIEANAMALEYREGSATAMSCREGWMAVAAAAIRIAEEGDPVVFMDRQKAYLEAARDDEPSVEIRTIGAKSGLESPDPEVLTEDFGAEEVAPSHSEARRSMFGQVRG